MKRYLRVWWIFTIRTTQIAFASRLGVVIFTVGKLLRFGMYAFFLFILVSKTQSLAGYSLWEVMFFYATFNLIDTGAQFFLREVYRFRSHVISGYFDQFLLWPFSPLFKSLFGGSDALDIPMLVISLVFVGIAAQHLDPTLYGILVYIVLIINAFVIALAFHMFVLAMGILTTEVDNTLWMYRDLTQMGRVPVDIYHQPIRNLMTFIIPVGIMMTFPVKALMGLLSVQWIVVSLTIGMVFLFGSLRFWHYALKQYASASS